MRTIKWIRNLVLGMAIIFGVQGSALAAQAIATVGTNTSAANVFYTGGVGGNLNIMTNNAFLRNAGTSESLERKARFQPRFMLNARAARSNATPPVASGMSAFGSRTLAAAFPKMRTWSPCAATQLASGASTLARNIGTTRIPRA